MCIFPFPSRPPASRPPASPFPSFEKSTREAGFAVGGRPSARTESGERGCARNESAIGGFFRAHVWAAVATAFGRCHAVGVAESGH